jgi:hypothetical protein
MRALSMVFLFAFLGGCSSNSNGHAPAAGGTSSSGGASAGGALTGGGAGLNVSQQGGVGGESSATSVTWAEKIAPIVFEECAGCHREGGIAPFSLTTYASAAPLASLLAEEVEGRFMPPMPVDNGGACNTYANARWLTDSEIALFRAWATAGAPEGDRSKVPSLPSAPRGIENPSATLDAGADYTPNAALADDYRCFVVDAGLASDAFLVGYEVLPGDAREVHHAIVYQPKSDAAASEAEALDAAESGLGYTCFGAAGVDAEPRALWAPGGSAVTLPKDTGLALVAGRKLILQVHYNLSAGAFPDRTRVRLVTASSVKRAATYLAAADTKMNVAAGQAEGTTMRTVSGTNEPLLIWGVLPHMHTLGRKLRVDAATASGTTCLVNVDRWDFHWQNVWWYESPISLDVFKSATISCSYDTRGRDKPVTWGEGTNDEMCLSYFYASAP